MGRGEALALRERERVWQHECAVWVGACERGRGCCGQHECGDGIPAEGRLRDTLHRVYTFGLSLNRLDIRQESSRHEEARPETFILLLG